MQAGAYMRHALSYAKARAEAGRRTTVCETGVYHGLSAANWLCAHPLVELYAFDVVVQPSVASSLHQLFPGRLKLLEGDSVHTLPAFKRSHQQLECNIVSVDGGHFGYVPLHDLYNFGLLSVPNQTLVLMDEVGYLNGAGRGWRSGVDSLGSPALANGGGRACCPDTTLAWTFARTAALVHEKRCFAPGGADSSFEVDANTRAETLLRADTARGWCEGLYGALTPSVKASFSALGIPVNP